MELNGNAHIYGDCPGRHQLHGRARRDHTGGLTQAEIEIRVDLDMISNKMKKLRSLDSPVFFGRPRNPSLPPPKVRRWPAVAVPASVLALGRFVRHLFRVLFSLGRVAAVVSALKATAVGKRLGG